MHRIMFVVAALAIAACGGGAGSSPGSSPGAQPPPAAGSAATDITVTLTGGADAGTYEAHPTNVTCSRGLTGEGSWGNQYSVPDLDGFSSLQLIVDDRQDAADGTSEFLTTVGMGILFGPDFREYTIDTRADASEPRGSGTVTVTDAGSTATVVIEGETTDGVGISATLRCNQVIGS